MKDIVFLHGLFMNPKSWKKWVQAFEAKGYTCHVPAYPYHEGDPTALRSAVPAGLGLLTLDRVNLGIWRLVSRMPEPPIAVGHSMGGLIVQILMNNGLLKAGVCISPAPPAGIGSMEWSFLRSNLPVINPLKGDTTYLMSRSHFHYTFCNTMSISASDQAYTEFLVPESRNIPRTVRKSGKVDFTRPHAPLLFVAGTEDHIIPRSLVERNWSRYTERRSKAELKVFPGRGHFICGQPGWEEVARFVVRWLSRLEEPAPRS